MQCGISTSCFYPQETAEALSALRGAGVETVEIFLNTFSELELSYTERLRSVLQDAGMRAAALHPFTSGMETFFFASEYGGRLEDGLRIYRRYFEVCRVLGIPRVVFHGDYRQTPFPFQRHCENYLLLRRTAREYGVDFCQENVVRCKCGLPEYVRQMREYTGDDVSFVLDVKQQRRAGVQLEEMLDAMRGKIAHVHLSDYTQQNDCTAPGTGGLALEPFFRELRRGGFAVDIIIELYRSGFSSMDELLASAAMVNKIYAGCSVASGSEKEQCP